MKKTIRMLLACMMIICGLCADIKPAYAERGHESIQQTAVQSLISDSPSAGVHPDAKYKGWVKISGKWYYYTSAGTKKKGWLKYKGSWYYLHPSKGYMFTGLHKISSKYYYFTSNGVMKTGWIKSGSNWYYFTSDGSAKTGWFKYNGSWYYLSKKNARMLKGLQTIASKIYFFDSGGVMQKGWVKAGSYWYYMTSDGSAKKGWLKLNGKTYYLKKANGRMLTGLRTISDKKYYFSDAGVMYKGWKKIGGKWCYFGTNGVMVSGKLPWPSKIKLPSKSELNDFSTSERSPYIVCRPQFSADTFSEFAVDFRADYLPRGTYLSVCNWDMTMDTLKSQYSNVWREYSGVAAYAGFQVLGDGSHVAIMSVWDTYYTDAYGNTKTIRAEAIYPDEGNSFSGEGDGIQKIVPYDWKEGKSYRALIQCGTSSGGTTTLIFWVKDLSSGSWTKLAEYDTKIKNTRMCDAAAFLENFLPQYAGEVRSMELWNCRVHSVSTGEWTGALSAKFDNQQFLSGSYNFGSYGKRFWAVTTGLKNRCTPPANYTEYTVSACDADSPY